MCFALSVRRQGSGGAGKTEQGVAAGGEKERLVRSSVIVTAADLSRARGMCTGANTLGGLTSFTFQDHGKCYYHPHFTDKEIEAER